jgi:hypothetical protein
VLGGTERLCWEVQRDTGIGESIGRNGKLCFEALRFTGRTGEIMLGGLER